MLICNLMEHIETFAPLSLALDWDNVGLMVGDPKREVKKTLIALDITQRAVEYAIETGADLILSHHPLIFQALKKITDPLLLKLIERQIAAVCLHTNLDVAPYGVSHALAEKLDFEILDHLSMESGGKWFHLCVSVSSEHGKAILKAASTAGAGRIGAYDSCSTKMSVQGSFRPLKGSNPYLGKAGELSRTREVLIEFMVDEGALQSVLAAIKQVHPFETPLLYYFPVTNSNPAQGLGLLCKAKAPMTLAQLARHTKQRLGCPDLNIWNAGKSLEMTVDRIAICGGAGNSLIKDAARKAEVLISGDISYHNLLDSPIPIIDAGHFYTEFPVLEYLAGQLSHIDIACEILPIEKHDLPLKQTRI